jgi:hypothetical protein
MDVQAVITRVRRVFGDEAAVQLTDDDIIRWINDGQIEVVKNNSSALLNTTTINIVANQSTYNFNSNMLKLRSVRYKYSDMASFRSLKFLSMQQFDESIDGWDGTLYPAGYPVFYTEYNDTFTVFPTPDRSVVGGFKLLYNETPSDVTDLADPLSLPLIYHNTIMRYCLWQASLLDEDLEPAVMYAQTFTNDMAVVQSREVNENLSSYPVITVREEDL